MFCSFAAQAETLRFRCDSGIELTINKSLKTMAYGWKKPETYILYQDVAYVTVHAKSNDVISAMTWAFEFSTNTIYEMMAFSKFSRQKHYYPEMYKCYP